ncbi:MAG: tRNA (adenosine(37)-N6)-threonylcarbamoyltransferase complex transferase subunit TsaD [Phycisphaerales bacterium]|nr:tRNA (adenosine(37)-N6)-threonylcarbamoyltransferase complex transferase subunit TsaD [Phycisphaerales bacterium]
MPDIVLAIETSCDETAAAVLADGRIVRSNIVASQESVHTRFGGVVPELAARAHVESIRGIIEHALHTAGVTYREVDAVAVTDGPGLVGSLLVGVAAARTLAWLLDRPLVPVDHIDAHAVSAALTPPTPGSPRWPAVALVVSGGHTSLYHVRDWLNVQLLGQTTDDAAGEAFDKVAAILELGYPGGPLVDRLARDGNPAAIHFPRTRPDGDSLDFSFSGLKTAVLYHVYGRGRKYGSVAHLSRAQLADIAASFQAALVEPLVERTIEAAQRVGAPRVVVGGGVAANGALRSALAGACAVAGLELILTPMAFCTDNAAMIALLGHHLWKAGRTCDLDLEPRSGLRRPARSVG